MIRILVLCTANSARSILAEALLNRIGADRFEAFSAGSHPRGIPNPDALAMLADKGYDISAFSSKSWDVFATADAPKMDVVITVCDNAAGETCPLWPGAPVKAHWGIPDPAGIGGHAEERRQAFEEAYRLLERRVQAMAGLPLENLDANHLKTALSNIGKLEGATLMALRGGD